MARVSFSTVLLSNVMFAGSFAYAQTSGISSNAAPNPPVSNAAAADADIPAIVVTALRVESRLQTTPAAITALSGADLANQGISNLQDLSLAVPGLSFGETEGQAHIAIRGIGEDNVVGGEDPRVAFYQDGVYIARESAQLGGLFDLERVEVLKGPQGTLYGRNATGGALNVISRAPTDVTTGYAELTYGNYNDVVFNGAVGGGLASDLSARIAVHVEGRDGYGENVLTGARVDDKSDMGVRPSLLWKLSDSLSLLTVLDYSRERDHDYGLHFLGQANPLVPVTGLALGGTALIDSRDIASDTLPQAQTQVEGITETAAYHADWGSLKSITAYRTSRTAFLSDVDGTSVQLGYDLSQENAKQFSQEIQADGDIGRANWLVGALYFHERDIANTTIPINLATVGGPLSLRQGFFSTGDLGTNALAPYIRAGYKVTDRLTLTVGGRDNVERRTIDDDFQFDFSRPYMPGNPIIPVPPFPRSAEVEYHSFIPTATVEYKVSDAVFTYATYSEGFKSGGFNVGVDQPAYLPETIKNYEVGVKTTTPMLGGHLDANLSAFHYLYSDLQVSQVQGETTVIENAAAATVNGVETQMTLGLRDGYLLDGSFTYLDSKYKNFVDIDPTNVAAGPQDLDGKRLTQAPRTSAALAAQKTWAIENGKLVARAEYTYVARVFFTPFNNDAVSQAGYGLGSGSVRYSDQSGWSIDAYVRNIANKLAVAQSYASSSLFGFPVLGTFIPPRTYGVTVRYEF